MYLYYYHVCIMLHKLTKLLPPFTFKLDPPWDSFSDKHAPSDSDLSKRSAAKGTVHFTSIEYCSSMCALGLIVM